MNIEDAIAEQPSGVTMPVAHGSEAPTDALFFRRDALDDEWAEELEIWLETAEAEEADEDLVLCGIHPVEDDSQVERMFYYRRSLGPTGPVFALDVDGTAVPGTLREYAESFEALLGRG